ncbi:hypothetical protein ACQHIV_39320 [Kribbella sp. GL6]|uniref:hypothetical protein n=1 Tax=Kribbella sp. GL6 TaxID=3419765 RepID=UPI003D06739D
MTLMFLGIACGPLVHLAGVLDRPGWRYVGYLGIAGYVGVACFVAWTAVTQRPYVVVDHAGVHVGRRSMAWTDVGSIGLVGRPARQLPIHPKNVWAKDLVITRQHVNDLESFRTWLEGVLGAARDG